MTLSEKNVEKILDRLPKLVVELDTDPSARGPKYLQEQIARVRGYLNETGVYIQDILREKSKVEARQAALQLSYQIESNRLMTEDPRVTRLPSIKDRNAMIETILRGPYTDLCRIKVEISGVSDLEKAIRHRHKELSDTMSAIRLQRTLIDTELRTGSFYGNESDRARGTATWGRKPPRESDELSEEELNNLLSSGGAVDGDDLNEKDIEKGMLAEEDDLGEEDIEKGMLEEENAAPQEADLQDSGPSPVDTSQADDEIDSLSASVEEALGLTMEEEPLSKPSETSNETESKPSSEDDVDPDILRFLGEDDDDLSDLFDSL